MHNYKIKTAKLTKLATVLSSAKGEEGRALASHQSVGPHSFCDATFT